jgi:hypothetical protein
VRLVPSQDMVARLLAESWRAGGRSTLLFGPAGSGKRTIAQTVAEFEGLAFREIPLSLPWGVALNALVSGGSTAADEDGVLTSGAPTLAYLSNVEQSDPSSHPSLMALFAQRMLPGNATLDRVPEEVWIVGGLSTDMEVGISLEHPVARAFRRRIRIDPPEPQEIGDVASRLLRDIAPTRTLHPDATTLLQRCLDGREPLRVLHAWLEGALARLAPDAVEVTPKAISGAIAEDLRSSFGALEYLGRRLPAETTERWLAQFPDELVGVAANLARQIARTYFIGAASYYEAVNELGRRVRDIAATRGDGRRVVMCSWQHMGKSAPAVAHDLKTLGNLDIAGELDLRIEPSLWPDEFSSSTFVIPDDMIGSGRTLGRLIANPDRPLPTLLSRYLGAHVVIPVLVAYIPGVQKAAKQPEWPSDDVTVIPRMILMPSDTCFSESSRVVKSAASRASLEHFCRQVAVGKMRGCRFPLGYQELGSLVVLHNTVPNNTVPIVWHDTGTWTPLFPASGFHQE